jgi:predicted alpha/beta hydrolase
LVLRYFVGRVAWDVREIPPGILRGHTVLALDPARARRTAARVVGRGCGRKRVMSRPNRLSRTGRGTLPSPTLTHFPWSQYWICR